MYVIFILQEYIRREEKPKTKRELIDGIEKCLGTVSIRKCRKYIGHLHKVLPEIVRKSGEATGY